MRAEAADAAASGSRGRAWAMLPYLVVFVLALGVRLLYLADAADNPSFLTPIVDAGAYDTVARQLLATGAAVPRLFWQPVLYPLILALVYLLSGGSIVAAKLVQAGLGALTAGLVYGFAARRLGRGEARVAGAIVILYGPLLFFEGELLATGLAALWAIALVVLADRCETAPGRWDWPLLGAAGALATLTRPTFLPFVVAVSLWLLWRRRRTGAPARAVAASATSLGVAFAVIVIPVALWSHAVTGVASFLPTSGGLNAYIGNNPSVCDTLTIRPGARWGELVTMPERAGVEGRGPKNRFYYGLVLDYALSEPLAFAAGLGRKALELVGSREIPRNVDVYLARRWSRLLGALCWRAGPFGFPFGLLLPLALIGAVLAGRRLGGPLLLLLVTYSGAIVLVFVSARYRVVLAPVLAVAAGAGVGVVAEAVRRRSWPRLGAIAGIVVASLVVATLPGPFCEERVDMEADFYYCLGFAAGERGDDEAALAAYRTALDVAPELGEVEYNIGTILSRRGDLEGAIAAYREAVRIAPDLAAGWLNLGSLLLRRGEVDEAVERLREAARLSPGSALAARTLAQALLERGDPRGALAAAERAVTLEPAEGEAHLLAGSALLAVGAGERALAELRRAVTLGPDSARAHLELGVALLGSSDPAAALPELERAAALDPGDARALNNAGVALAMLGRLGEARERFSAAVERSPRYADARFNLARALLASGNREGAAAELETLLELEPQHAAARRLLDRLERGG